jgi:hypothetical protein
MCTIVADQPSTRAAVAFPLGAAEIRLALDRSVVPKF